MLYTFCYTPLYEGIPKQACRIVNTMSIKVQEAQKKTFKKSNFFIFLKSMYNSHLGIVLISKGKNCFFCVLNLNTCLKLKI